MTLFTRAFWRSIGWALVRSGLAALAPFVPGLTSDPGGTWVQASGVVGLVLVLTAAAGLVSIPSTAASPWWEVALTRALRQFGQWIIAGTTTAVLMSDVDWRHLLLAAAASAATTLILAAVDAIPTVPAHALLGWDVAGEVTPVGKHAERDNLATLDPHPVGADPGATEHA